MRIAWLDDLRAIPSESLARRALYAAVIAAGITMTAYGSIFLARTGPIPFRFLPDVRPVLLVGSGLMLGLYAAGGGAKRRAIALWGVVGYVIAFHLEEALVHWIGPFPGSITGTPIGIVGTLGSLLALVGVLLMHVEVESGKLAKDLRGRGADAAHAMLVSSRLAALGQRRIMAIGVGVAGIGALLLAIVPAFGYDAAGGPWVLPVGGALLLGLAFALSRLVPRKAERA